MRTSDLHFALVKPFPEEFERVTPKPLLAPGHEQWPAVEVLAFDCNSTVPQVALCGRAAAKLVEAFGVDLFSANSGNSFQTKEETILELTERIVGLCSMVSNTLTRRLSLAEWHSGVRSLEINLASGRLSANWSGMEQSKSFELGELIYRTARESVKFCSDSARRASELIIGQLIDNEVPLPGFSLLSSEESIIRLAWRPIVQEELAA